MDKMTRAQMTDEAFRLKEGRFAQFATSELAGFCMMNGFWDTGCICPSILLSEAHRPKGHNGDGTDDV